MRTINYLVVHCDATRPSTNFDVSDIDRIHREKGWNGVGYHWFIRRDGTLQPGRSESVIGAHVYGHNNDSIGICLAGGLNEDTFKPENNYTNMQFATLEVLLREKTEEYPGARVLGHRDFLGVKKACPCFDVIPWWAEVLEDEETVSYTIMVTSDTPLRVIRS